MPSVLSGGLEALRQLGLISEGQAGADEGARTRDQRESRYDLAAASPIGAACPTRATRHWTGRLGMETQDALWDPDL
jgi:hypothetical protein